MPWLISRFPELDHLEPAQRAQVLRQVPWWTYPILILRAVTVAFIAILAVAVVLARMLGTVAPLIWIALPLGIVVAIALYRIELARIRRAMRRVIAGAFRGQRLPFCFNCGYDLRGAQGQHCPECGNPATLRHPLG